MLLEAWSADVSPSLWMQDLLCTTEAYYYGTFLPFTVVDHAHPHDSSPLESTFLELGLRGMILYERLKPPPFVVPGGSEEFCVPETWCDLVCMHLCI